MGVGWGDGEERRRKDRALYVIFLQKRFTRLDSIRGYGFLFPPYHP